MIFPHKRTLVIFLYFFTAASAYAQICKEPGSNASPPKDHVYIDCDMSYRDMQVTCDDNAPSGQQTNPGTRPPCPKKPMPRMETPNRSLVKEYSPYLYAYPRDPIDKSKAYNDLYIRGTPGGPDKVYNMFGNVANLKSIANCQDQIRTPNQPGSVQEEAKVVRLQMDNCANQYIMLASPYAYSDSRARLINNPQQSALPISPATECQPLKIASSMKYDNEYLTSDYLVAAWKKSLEDANYRKHKSVFSLPAIVKTALSAVGVNIPNILDNKSEPHYPKGTTLANPIPVPANFPEMRPSNLMATPKGMTTSFEKIIDPTHPFSPRWDFPFNEREFYSPMVMFYQNKWYNLANPADNRAVYCAGVREAKNKSGKEKQDLEVKVDVLKFREKKFTEGIMQRIGWNTMCKMDNSKKEGRYPGVPNGNPGQLLTDPTTYCIKPQWANVIICTTIYYATEWLGGIEVQCDKTAKQLPCWECYKLGNDKVDDEKKFPPCTTHYDGKDRKIRSFPVLPGLRNEFRYKAPCRILPFIGKRPDIVKLCADLRRPYTQINRLKLRYHNKDDKDNNAMENAGVLGDGGPAEGMSFNDYFKPMNETGHMPYPRIWDTGTSLHKTKVKDTNYQSPTDVTGQYVSIVGVGHEGAPKSAGDDAQKKHPDERCRFGGWGGDSVAGQPTGTYLIPEKFAGLEAFNLPDPMTSWTELKMYQARTMRLSNITCIGRYEKVFKSGSSEALALAATGGEWSRIIVQECPRGKMGSTDCTFMTLKDFKDKSHPLSDKNTYRIPETKIESWPLAWRGYLASGTVTLAGGNPMATGKNQFPNFGATGGVSPALTTKIGLGNAELGDLVLLPRGSSKLGDKPGLAKVGIVSEVNLPKAGKASGEQDCTDRKDCYIQVLEADNGKWPDACGSTDSWGELKTRYLYMPGMEVPSANALNMLGYTHSCEDSQLSRCEMVEWKNIPLYRIRNDIRVGCNKTTSKECADD